MDGGICPACLHLTHGGRRFGTVMRMMNTEMKMTPRAIKLDEGAEL
jgi:hypothetical protein